LDFNTEFVQEIGKIKGSNYFSVSKEEEFQNILKIDFNYIITPISFNTKVLFESEKYYIDEIYGTQFADKIKGECIKIMTCCGSDKDEKKRC